MELLLPPTLALKPDVHCISRMEGFCDAGRMAMGHGIYFEMRNPAFANKLHQDIGCQ